MILCACTLALLTYSCLVDQKVTTGASRNAARLSFTEDAYLVYLALVTLAPLGLIYLTPIFLVFKDPAMNFLWRRDKPRSLRQVIFHNPNKGIGTRINRTALIAVVILTAAFVGLDWWRSDFWLLSAA